VDRPGVAPSLSEVLPALTTAWRNLSVYPEGHPARAASLETAHRRLTALLSMSGPLSLGVAREGFVCGDKHLTTPPARALGEALQRRGAAVLRFEEGVELRELEAFLRCLREPGDLAEPLPLDRELALADVERVVVTPVDYEALVLTDSVPPRPRSQDLWQALLDALLAGKRLDADGAPTSPAEASPEGIALLLLGPAAAPAGAADRDARLEALSGAIESHFRDTPGPARAGSVRQLAELLRALPRDVRERVLVAALKVLASEESTEALLDSLAAEGSADEVLQALRRLSLEGVRLSPHALGLLQALAAVVARARAERSGGPRDTDAIVAELAALFREEDIDRWNPDDHQALLEQAATVDFAALHPGPVGLDLGDHAVSLEDAGIQERLAATLLEMIGNGATSPEVLLRLEGAFGDALDAGRTALAVSIARGLRSLERDERLPPEDRSRLVELLARLADSRQVFLLAGSRAQAADPALDGLHELIGLLGGAGARSLLRALAEESNQSRRRRLFDALVSLGRAVVPEATRLLSDPRWYVVRNVIRLLRAVEDRSSLPLVRRCAESPDLRVRLEAIKTLLAFEPGLAHELLAQAIDDPDPKLAEAAVALAGQYGIREASDLLLSILDEWDLFGARRPLRLMALRALADLADPAVLPALDRFLSRGWGWPPVAREERRAAFRLLEAYPREARHPYVARGSRSRDPVTRQVCLRLLREEPETPPTPAREDQ
jgi:hypothetical protein